jgi:hypothetical protein
MCGEERTLVYTYYKIIIIIFISLPNVSEQQKILIPSRATHTALWIPKRLSVLTWHYWRCVELLKELQHVTEQHRAKYATRMAHTNICSSNPHLEICISC